ncbi:FAD-binding domain-containing protein [Cristinia sonorae]|uniref:FAD-binding domain-containing protein n=1 Tax=Cristinia sonorae TaxID=1940300 RepID=A0A8K0XMT8_9AGAR|nr:FAD-binding domain-containing protein [Cristinia sonorae]
MSDIYTLGIQGKIVTQHSPDFEAAIARRATQSVLRAAYIVYPLTVKDIPLAINFALAQDPPLEIAIKGGGCHTSSNSSTDGGLVIDLCRMNAVKVSEDKKTVTIQGGALWGDVYIEADKQGVAVVGGNTWFVGVGGYLTGGGYSSLSGEYGLAIDNLLSAEVVLADGRVVRCSENEEPDLFWAIRGGGNQFGVVTEFVVKAHPGIESALVGALAYPATELDNVLEVVKNFLDKQGSNAWLNIGFLRMPPHYKPCIMLIPTIYGDQAAATASIQSFHTEITPIFGQTGFVAGSNAIAHGGDAFLLNAPPRSSIGGAYFGEFRIDVAREIFSDWMKFTAEEGFKESLVMFEFAKRGKVDSVPLSATAFPVRDPHWFMASAARYHDPSLDKSAKDWVAKITSYAKDKNEESTGKRLCTPTNWAQGPDYETLEEVFGENLLRLRKVKAKYDQKKVWRRGWVIEPL